MSAPDVAQIQSVRSEYEALLAEADPGRTALNNQLANADRKGDMKAVKRLMAESLARPHPISDWLHTVSVPPILSLDLAAYVGADEKVRNAVQAYARAKSDQDFQNAQHQRNVALRVDENAVNQFRVDLGITRLPCPFIGQYRI